MPYEKTVVSKPWGYEYLAYQNEKVALWFLYIGHDQQTSMHCHPNKTTGLILLDGEAEISFLGDSFNLKPVSKTMIRKGLFHSTKATSENGACVFEIETPVDKHDLVRLEDKYGREGNPYEDSTHETPKQDDCLWIEDIVAHYKPEGEVLDERLGGKGYSRKAAASSVYPGKKGTGDWEDSDRGAGNKAARRAGKKVEKKSPTYRAYVLNKEEVEIDEATRYKKEKS